MKLYGHELSGNAYKVELLLNLLGLEYEFVRVDLMAGEHKQLDFLALNPFGQVPVLVDGDRVLQDAQAILAYLGGVYGGDAWLPRDPQELPAVIRWLSTTTGEIRQGPESARLYHLFGATNINIERATEKSHFILQQLDDYLSDRAWLEFGRPTIADVAVFPYVALARDGKIDLDRYPNVLAWIERVQQLDGFRPAIGIEMVAA